MIRFLTLTVVYVYLFCARTQGWHRVSPTFVKKMKIWLCIYVVLAYLVYIYIHTAPFVHDAIFPHCILVHVTTVAQDTRLAGQKGRWTVGTNVTGTWKWWGKEGTTTMMEADYWCAAVKELMEPFDSKGQRDGFLFQLRKCVKAQLQHHSLVHRSRASTEGLPRSCKLLQQIYSSLVNHHTANKPAAV